MIRSIHEFDEAIRIVREQTGFHDFLVNNMHLPLVYSTEILRSQLVCAVSAMDRFFHEMVRIGFLESYKGKRVQTSKFKTWQFSNDAMLSIIRYSDSKFIPTSLQETPEYIIEQDVVNKLSVVSYQHPDKIKDALSYVWAEPHKMQVIATSMGYGSSDGQKILEQKLKMICERRNQVVHEGDIEPTTRKRRNIDQVDVNDNIAFIERFCHTVFSIVTDSACYVTTTVAP